MRDFDRLPIRYRAKYDYGSRRGYPTRALVFHMAEGTNVARYLSSGNIARGVSVHYTIERKTSTFRDGEIIRILPEHRISGSINPDTLRRTDDPNGFYGIRHNRHALGKWWGNPNVAVISVEVAGRAKDGPTDRQVAAMDALFEDIDRRYGRVIPLGHRDFQHVKPCPGAITRFRVNSIITTLGTLLLFRGLTKILGAGTNISVDGFGFLGRTRFDVAGIQVPLSVLILAVVLVAFWFIMSWLRYGRHMTAMGANPRGARLAGIDLEKNVLKGFLLTGLVVGLASLIVVSQLGATSPTTAQGLEFLALTAVILGGASLSGGRGTIVGTTIAVLILAVIDNGLTLSRVSSFWQEVVRGGLLIGAVALDQLRIARHKTDSRFEL